MNNRAAGAASKVRRLRIGVALAAVLLLIAVLLTVSYSGVGVAYEVGKGGSPLSLSSLSVVPQPVVDDATELATELFGDRQRECENFVGQTLATYLETKDEDFIIVFSAGGWGWNLLEASQGWHSMVGGIQTELASLGYQSLAISYQRTAKTVLGQFDELVEMVTGYPTKAKDLACRLDFLTTHVPDLKVIIVGESTGTLICDSVVNILKDNPQVYSIQTGPLFWHESIMPLDRTLVVTNNGIVPDSLSRGDFGAIIGGNLRALLRLSELQDDFGTPPHRVGAPGHDYWWQYPEVRSRITNFLDKHFGTKLGALGSQKSDLIFAYSC